MYVYTGLYTYMFIHMLLYTTYACMYDSMMVYLCEDADALCSFLGFLGFDVHFNLPGAPRARDLAGRLSSATQMGRPPTFGGRSQLSRALFWGAPFYYVCPTI